MKYFILIALLCFSILNLKAKREYKVTDNQDYTSLYFFNPQKKGFEVSVSGVFMFTTGAKDRNGFRWGASINLLQDIGDFKLSTGIDFYKAKQKFDIGTTYAGITYDDDGYGGSYYVNKYFQGDKQISGLIALYLSKWQIRFEDDILAVPFTNFIIYDRYRTAGLEVRYRNLLIGGNVYTTDPNGLIDISTENKKGSYHTGKQISSPMYVGYTDKSFIIRSGINSKIGGNLVQNFWHRKFFDTGDFKYGAYNQPFMQIGIDKPYTLY